MNFKDLKIQDSLLQAVLRQGYTAPTPIQEQAIPLVLAGRDVLGCAQTGTGKTAAFALPILQRLSADLLPKGKRPAIRALIITPTRELASQIGESFSIYGARTGLKATVIFGGVKQFQQTRILKRGVDILVATPGRLLDLMNQGHVELNSVKVFVLDEADRMLDMGFINDIKRVIQSLPRKRQTLLFSATVPPAISKLAQGLLDNPATVSVTPPGLTLTAIKQSVFFVEKKDKISLLVHLLQQGEMLRTLVFSRTKHGANKIVRKLEKAGIGAVAIHGNKSQNRREQALADFKRGKSPVLVATDIASRGLDIEKVSHVVNLDLPNESEVYVHRIGRTGRAGLAGIAISFCSSEEQPYLRDIERLIRRAVPVQEGPSFLPTVPEFPESQPAKLPGRRSESANRPYAERKVPASSRRYGPRRNRGNGYGSQSRRSSHA